MTTELQEQPKRSVERLAGKYLTFALQGQSYGIDVLQVREIIRRPAITAVPQMPAYVRGVVNLRGKIIPVTDLRLRFGSPHAEDTDLTCIVVVQVKLADGKLAQTGLIVDGVEEVIQIAAADIEEPPSFGSEVAGDYLLGMAKVKGVVKTLLNINCIVGTDNVSQIVSTASGTPINA
jgi:purine-binding chemotaxis protein CheW